MLYYYLMTSYVLGKIFSVNCKMALAEKIKTLDDEIKASKDQYDLDIEADKIFALSSGRLEKYYYLTGEDLGYKPEPIEKAKFGYSPLI